MRFTLYSIAVLVSFVALEWRGVDLWPTTQRFSIPASVRSSPGGYRSYHTYFGFHGGK